jgi:osmotically-inducible protein OsmY
LRRVIEQELEWEPSLDERRSGVSVIDGIVPLTGDLSSYAEKWKAERAVERGSVRSWVERHEAEKSAWAAPGVRAVHNHITVEPVAAAA